MAKRRKLTPQQRNRIADKLVVWANMVFAGMAITQLVSGKFSVSIALADIFLFVATYLLAYYGMKGVAEVNGCTI
jgi:hypothetical protein